MIIARVTSKGQITLPKKVREKLGVQPGEAVGFEEMDDQVFIRKAVVRSPFDKWVGKLGHLRGKRSDDIVKEARGHDNGR